MLILISALISPIGRSLAAPGDITTVAGSGPSADASGDNGGFSGDGGPATSARLYFPWGLAVDGPGNVFIADQYNNRIREVEGVAAATCPAGALFCDDFNDNSIDGSKWTYSGNTVTESDGIMKLDNVVVDNYGRIQSKAIAFDPSAKLTLSRRVKIHYSNQYLNAYSTFSIDGIPAIFGVGYSNSIASGQPYCAVEPGFYLINNVNLMLCSSVGNRSPRVEPIWDSWFAEQLVYTPSSGLLEYYIDGIKKTELNIGPLPTLPSYNLHVNFDSAGWWTGHYQYFDDLVVTQEAATTCANVTCTPLDQCHLAGVCDPSTGNCSNPEAPNGTTCDDGKAETPVDQCDGAGKCVGLACPESTVDDRDGDGIRDDWEDAEHGIDVGGGHLDLHEMGADSRHKDVFVEVDYMVKFVANANIITHNHQPKPDALKRVIESFFKAPVCNPDGTPGINLHVDAGPKSLMDPRTGREWGDMSESNALLHQDTIDEVKAVDILKNKWNFRKERLGVFHYAAFVHKYVTGDSGMGFGDPAAKIGAQYFIVSLGGVGTELEQAGTFMHELGHNLGLGHGGPYGTLTADQAERNWKPNYLSVMNYFFQMSGLNRNGGDGVFDYAGFGPWENPQTLGALNEMSLVERDGLNASFLPARYGTKYFCPSSRCTNDITATCIIVPGFLSFECLFKGGCEKMRVVPDVNAAIDWDCDGDDTQTVSADINNCAPVGSACKDQDIPSEQLETSDDWRSLYLKGGLIGKGGISMDIGSLREGPAELTAELNAAIPHRYAVSAVGPAQIPVAAGGTLAYGVIITNTGQSGDRYLIERTSQSGWASLADVPAEIFLSSGEVATSTVNVHVPLTAIQGASDEVRFRVTSVSNPLISDSATTMLSVSEAYLELDLDGDGQSDHQESGPNGDNPLFDGNHDGIPDRLQSNVTSLHSADGKHYVTLAVPSSAALVTVRAVPNPSPETAPRAASFPYGFFEFTITGLEPGGSVALTMYFPGSVSDFYKWGPTPDNTANHWYRFVSDGTTGATFGVNQVTLLFRDGARGDDDLNATNGVIVDAGGPALPAAVPVPVLSPWGLATLTLALSLSLVGLVGVRRVRRG